MTAAELQRRWTETLERKDAAEFAQLYAPNAIVHDPSYERPLEGRDAIRDDVEAFYTAFPDIRVRIHTRIEEDGLFATQAVFEGTHQGALPLGSQQIPPTGRRVAFNASGFYRLDGQGRILEEHRYYDVAGLLSQVGALT